MDLKKFFTHPRAKKGLSPPQFVTALLKNILSATSRLGNNDSTFKDFKWHKSLQALEPNFIFPSKTFSSS